ncbi:hypothetical protein ACFL6U_24120 [Planctomycetota bacterium]
MLRASWRQRYLAFLVEHLLVFRRRGVSSQDLQQADYSTSTQRLGVRFTRKLRDTFRFRWLRPR